MASFSLVTKYNTSQRCVVVDSCISSFRTKKMCLNKRERRAYLYIAGSDLAPRYSRNQKCGFQRVSGNVY